MTDRVTGLQPTIGPTTTPQESAGLTPAEEATIIQGAGTVAAGFLMLLQGEQKKLLNETANEANK